MNDQDKQLISSYIDGGLTQDEKKRAEDLILKDKDCQQYYKELMKLSTTLSSWDDEELSPDLINEIQKTLLEAKIQEEKSKMKITNPMIRVGGGVFVTIAAVVVVVAVMLQPGGVYQQSYFKGMPQTHEVSEVDNLGVTKMTTLSTTTERFSEGMTASTLLAKGEMKTAADDIGDQFSAGNEQVVRVARTKENIQMKDRNAGISSTAQYEPYYLKSDYKVTRADVRKQSLDEAVAVGAKRDMVSTRSQGGFQQSSYNGVVGGLAGVDAPAKSKIKSKKVARLESEERARVAQRRIMPATAPVAETEAMDSQIIDVQQEFWGGGELWNARENTYRPEEQQRTYADYDRRYNDYYRSADREEYEHIYENYFVNAQHNPLSTFSADVDTASYSNVRRFLNNGQLPPADAVRIEEMINYFNYDYPKPKWGDPFSVTTDGVICPWNQNHYLVRIGLQGAIPKKTVPSNLVFLIDVSGSMNQPNKLPLLKQSLKMMAQQLRADERVAIVTYSGSARVLLNSTPGSNKHAIMRAIDNLRAGGSTAGEAGLRLAYNIADRNFIRHGNNRIVLATDGDFNVGMSSDHDMVRLIEDKRRSNVFLSVLGFGTGNLKDAKMQKIASHGNGEYYYIDSIEEGQKVLVDELGSTLLTIAKDVKIQVEFNPQHVRAYKLIGYENRLLSKQDFNNDRVDAGEIGAGHTVTALYEIIPNVVHHRQHGVDPLVYQKQSFFKNNDLMTVKLRYKHPQANRSKLIKRVFKQNQIQSYVQGDLGFASAVAQFGLLLRHSPGKGHASYRDVITHAQASLGADKAGHRREFINMVEKAAQLDHRPDPYPYRHPEPWTEHYYEVQPDRRFKGE